MMRILLNSIALDPHRWQKGKIAHFPLSSLLSPIAESGFHFIEVWQYHISRENENSVHRILDLGDSLGVSFPIVGAYPQLHLSGDERNRELDRFKRIIEFARILRTRIVKIFAGSKGTEELDGKEYKRSVEFLQQMIDLAAATDLTITGELHRKTLLDSIASTRELLATLNTTDFRICYQPFDFRATERAVTDYAALADVVAHVHYQGRRSGKFESLEKSDIDYALLTRELINHGFDGYVSIEFVKDCAPEKHEHFDLQTVLANAIKDREYLAAVLAEYEVNYQV